MSNELEGKQAMDGHEESTFEGKQDDWDDNGERILGRLVEYRHDSNYFTLSGTLLNGKLHGRTLDEYDVSQAYVEQYWEHGVKQGPYIFSCPHYSHALVIGQFFENLQYGIWREWDKDRRLIREAEYGADGKLIGMVIEFDGAGMVIDESDEWNGIDAKIWSGWDRADIVPGAAPGVTKASPPAPDPDPSVLVQPQNPSMLGPDHDDWLNRPY